MAATRPICNQLSSPQVQGLRNQGLRNQSPRAAGRVLLRAALATLVTCSAIAPKTFAVESVGVEDDRTVYLPYAQFQIPFNVDSRGTEPTLVQLWVSTDEGNSWQLHGSADPGKRRFEFRAAAEGLYLFAVHTVDASGASFPSSEPAMRVQVDTTQPQAEVRADVDATGKLVIDVRASDEHLDKSSAVVRMRTDRESEWIQIPVSEFQRVGDTYQSQFTQAIGSCREVALIFSVADQARNVTESTYQFTMPRTAANEQDMRLASTGNGTGARANVAANSRSSGGQVVPQPNTGASRVPSIPGAIPWGQYQASTDGRSRASIGTLASGTTTNQSSEASGLELSLGFEELPLPAPEGYPTSKFTSPNESTSNQNLGTEALRLEALQSEALDPGVLDANSNTADAPATDTSPNQLPMDPDAPDASSTVARAFHCNSRAFSLDYSVEALGGSKLADVELWGTEDGGRVWQLWGSDPDRQSPFDVQVGNDGMFGYRMVIVGSNGIVSNRPKSGDTADVWINVDSKAPAAKITRAVYGEGPEDGMLVIDYVCDDTHLVDRPLAMYYSERVDGPWTPIATGLKNTGIYLWKPDPNLPERIFLKLEAVDKAGNVGTHRLDLPIDIKGLAPRGRIQGFRPITLP